MEFRNWAIIFATLMGPVLAVQAQKWVELLRETRNRKLWVFSTLMATRQARTSPDHVRALNMIDLAFDGRRILWFRRRTKSEKEILDAWHVYLNHLSIRFDQTTLNLWAVRGNELFTALLGSIAADLGFRFDDVQLMTSSYTPVVHAEVDNEQTQIRKQLVKLLSGEAALHVKNVEGNSDAPS